MQQLSTGQVAKLAGVPKSTLLYWLKKGWLGRVRSVRLPGGQTHRFWTAAHVARARKLKGTLRPGPKPKPAAAE